MKVNDEVRIVKDTSNSNNKTGDVGIITEISGDGARVNVNGNYDFGNWSKLEDLELTDNTMKKAVKDLLKEAYNSSDVCTQWKDKIKDVYPEVTPQLEVGKWYRDLDGDVFFVSKWIHTILNSSNGYGFCRGRWTVRDGDDNIYRFNDRFRPATDQEVEEALIKEAKKRGFKEGVKVIGLNGDDEYIITGGFWSNEINHLGAYKKYSTTSGACIFKDGQWAEIIENKLSTELQNVVDKLGKEEILKLLK